jgi:hypothetical protein
MTSARKRTIAATALCLALCGSAAVASPQSGPLAPGRAEAQVTKSRGTGAGGGGNVGGIGQRLGGLLSGWGVPLTIAIGGFLILGAFANRNIGGVVGVAAAVIVVLIFFLDPTAIENAAKNISRAIF